MSAYLNTESGIIKKVPSDQDDKESKVDIYVSAESLRIYENPWVESKSPNISGLAEARHPVFLIRENSGKRSHIRNESMLLGALCLLFLAGIIGLGIKRNQDKACWDVERNQLLTIITDLRNTTDQLKATNTNLSKEMCRDLCDAKPDKDSELLNQIKTRNE